ncbi:MAG: IS5 family transposase [Parcubacteria group bacterium]
MRQPSFLAIAQNKKQLKCERFLNEMRTVVPWQELTAVIEPFYQKEAIGRGKMDLLLMLKIYFLQQWYDLSDPGAEEAIYDRNSFQKFLEIDLISAAVPDETTILNFRHLLEANRLQTKMFEAINAVLKEKNMIMKNGVILDATIIHAPKSTKNIEKKRDPEMSSTQKNGQWQFGMKAHINVDCDKGLVKKVKITTAKVHDKKRMDELLDGDENAIFGDKAYADQRIKMKMRREGRFYGILDKGVRNKKLSASQHKRNRKLSSIRCKVERPFLIIKCLWHHTKTRYRGLNKNGAQLTILFGLANLYLVRKQLLCA